MRDERRALLFKPMSGGLSLSNGWVFLATVGGVGLWRWGPGTAGSLIALPMAWALLYWGGMTTLLIAVIVVALIGIPAGDHVERNGGGSDPGAVVIDEVAGQWLTVYIAALFVSDGVGTSLLAFIICFATFRIFDITKPWPCSWVDRRVHGGTGIMADDLVAAIYAGATTALLLWASSSLLGIG
jgi:phosphatidylglycerophosphatase A